MLGIEQKLISYIRPRQWLLRATAQIRPVDLRAMARDIEAMIATRSSRVRS